MNYRATLGEPWNSSNRRTWKCQHRRALPTQRTPSWLWLHHRRDATIVGVINLADFLTALVIRLNGG